MSGGSWDYFFLKISDVQEALESHSTLNSDQIEECLNYEQKTSRLKLAKVMGKISEAMKAIEWVDSGDYDYPHDTKAVEKAMNNIIEIIQTKPT